ncbi:MAG: amino acid adenylation domain-containing protein [Pseudomonadota bacterium]
MADIKEKKQQLMRYLLEQVKTKQLAKEDALTYLTLLDSNEPAPLEDIAIVGISCNFPQASNKEIFWHNLVAQRNCIRAFPAARRRDMEALDASVTQLFEGGFLDSVSGFDNEYFNIPPAVAEHMDPYHRLMLQSLVEAIEDAGYYRQNLFGKAVGIYVGNDHSHRMINSYLNFIDRPDFNSVTGSWTAVLASRLSYLLNLRGPAVVVDTSCSSGLVAMDYAIKGLRSGDCDVALVATANLFFVPSKGVVGDVENDDFVVRTFDQGASGTVWGEGLASIMIKPLAAAQRDKDAIYGIIKGIAVNNDGASSGLTAPNSRAQQEVMLEAWKRAGISAEDLSYIESHGTGTHLGDPIEIKALTNAFQQHTPRKQFCGIGSVKTNIGHTVANAGLASVIKVLLSLKHQQLPASLNFQQPNPFIDFCNSPVFVNDQLSAWPVKKDAPRFAGVSSFSLSGTNCHLVIQEPPFVAESLRESSETNKNFILAISGRTPELLLETIYRYQAFAQQGEVGLNAFCFSAAVGREHHQHRVALLVNSLSGLIQGLDAIVSSLTQGNAWPEQAIKYEANETAPASTNLNHQARLLTEKSEFLSLTDLRALAKLYVQGARVEWDAMFAAADKQRVHLPAQPWQLHDYWLSPSPRLSTATKSTESDLVSDRLKIICDELQQGHSPISGVGENADANQLAERFVAYAIAEILGYKNLIASDNFFARGGDSITGARIIHLLNELLAINIPVADLLAAATLGDFVRGVTTDYSIAERLRNPQQTLLENNITRIAAADFYSLSRAQQRMFLLAGITPDSTSYNVNGIVELEYMPDMTRTQEIINSVAARHEILRTGFVIQGETPVQFIVPDVNVPVSFTVLDGQLAVEDSVNAWFQQLVQPFDLSKPALLRLGFASSADGRRHFMAIDMHHIVTDGSSMGVLIGDYLRMLQGDKLAALTIQYKDFADWHNRLLAGPDYQHHANYWLDRYQDLPPDAELPLDFARPNVQTFVGERRYTHLSKELVQTIKQQAAAEGVSLFMWLNAAFRVLLHKYNVEKDLVLGTPVSGRMHHQLQPMIGMFVNTLALRFNVDEEENFSAMLARIKQQILSDFSHQDYPYEALVEQLNLVRNTGRNPLFDIYFVLQNEDMGLDTEGARLLPLHAGTSKFDLTIIFRETANHETAGISIEWEYATSLFRAESIQRMAEHFHQLLTALTYSNKKIIDLDLLDEEERLWLVETANQTTTHYPSDKSINALFEQQVALNPAAPALCFLHAQGRQTLTYNELNRSANQLAHYLQQANIKTNDVVALYLPREPMMVIAIMASLKLGCTYLPIDADSPPDRNINILRDSGAVAVISYSTMPSLDGASLPVFELDAVLLDNYEDSNLPGVNTGENLAYLMYTSGTTGKPKGAMIRHKSVTRVVMDTNYIALKNTDVCLLLSSFSFDGCVPDLFGALLNGGCTLLVTKKDVLDLPALGNIIESEKVTSMFVTTALFNVMVDNILDKLHGLRYLMFGGEMVSPPHVAKAIKTLGPSVLRHVYGPTETTVFATAGEVSDIEVYTGLIHIGKPISNTSVYILDADQRLLPRGIPGELYIGGDGVATGYLNRPELTQERFIPNPFLAGDVLYRTGDKVRYLQDGNIQYLCRMDQQVKIRGFRIELNEIRLALNNYPGVIDSIVTADADASGTRLLLAYVAVSELETFAAAALQQHLRRSLPDYMIPVAITPLLSLPLNNNGKIDKQRLPLPELSSGRDTQARNALEEQLQQVWCEVLNLGEIDRTENFFSLGGDSIKAIQVVARLQQHKISLDAATLFQHQNIESLASHLATRALVVEQVIDQGPVTGALILSPIQQWFLEQPKGNKNYFNHAIWIELDELPSAVALDRALRQVIAHHDLLRSCFIQSGNAWAANIASANEVKFYLHSYSDGLWQPGEAKTDAALMELQQHVNIATGCNLVAGIFPGARPALCIAVHHLVIDVVSWNILLQDINHCLDKPEQALPAKTVSFQTWSHALQELSNSEPLLESTEYWNQIAAASYLTLADKQREPGLVADSQLVRVVLDEAATTQLLRDANNAYNTEPQHLLLTALANACQKIYGTGNVLLNMENHGRDSFQGLNANRTLGWFTTVYPFLIQHNVQPDEAIKNLKESLRAVSARAKDFGLLAYCSGKINSATRNNLRAIQPQIGFNFLGQIDNSDLSIVPLDRKLTTSPDMSQNLLVDLVLSIHDKQLTIETLYDGTRITAAQVETLLRAYIDALHEIIAHCCSREHNEKTASDFTITKLNQSELEDIFEDLDL